MPPPLLNSAQSEKSLDSDGRRYFENRNDFPGFAAQAITEETDVFNGQLNTNVNRNTNVRVPWMKVGLNLIIIMVINKELEFRVKF